jgi:Rhodopirellula transposase DDE domain
MPPTKVGVPSTLALQQSCLEHREGRFGAFPIPNRHRRTTRSFPRPSYLLPTTTHGPSRRLPFLYWRSGRDFLLGIRRGQPAGAHVHLRCSKRRTRLVAPGEPARLVSLRHASTRRRQRYRNKIAHRLFAFISQNWRATPLVSYRVIVDLISATTTDKGLIVRCELDERTYPKAIAVSDQQMGAIRSGLATVRGTPLDFSEVLSFTWRLEPIIEIVTETKRSKGNGDRPLPSWERNLHSGVIRWRVKRHAVPNASAD